ncbi:MAG: M14 family zinc carboxypeptidase, partial [Bacteroidota bacterium]
MTKFLSPGQNPGAKPVENPFCFSAKYIPAKAFKAVKNNHKIVLLIAYLVFLAGNLPASNQQNQLNDYSDHQQMKENLEQLVRDHSDVASLQSLGRTAGDKDILLLTIGTGDTANKPALAVVGGISGDHLLGSELALQFAAKLLAQRQEPAIRHLLDSVVFYIFPDMSPDARE